MKYAIKIYDDYYLKKVGLTKDVYDKDLLEFNYFSDAANYIEENFDRKSQRISIVRIIDR